MWISFFANTTSDQFSLSCFKQQRYYTRRHILHPRFRKAYAHVPFSGSGFGIRDRRIHLKSEILLKTSHFKAFQFQPVENDLVCERSMIMLVSYYANINQKIWLVIIIAHQSPLFLQVLEMSHNSYDNNMYLVKEGERNLQLLILFCHIFSGLSKRNNHFPCKEFIQSKRFATYLQSAGQILFSSTPIACKTKIVFVLVA